MLVYFSNVVNAIVVFVLLCLHLLLQRVEAARQPHWINTLLYPPYLTQSPAEVYLRAYYPDAVGMSATERVSVDHSKLYRPIMAVTSDWQLQLLLALSID